ncbi:hypothetical protein [Thioalkalivibrio sp. XN279]|uniref:hypothetical protein n=1 Tax=Thioalkalivibrio sp. XN279 TaxID=2714953 RepID=UPI0014081E04|nr:hypothetical protein [Thioalkalivibrio sp. XN279]NHA13847.1 hypothetical protein [Thioalkalivibrio sp. XN279]
MHPFEMVVIIVFLALAAKVISQYMQHKRQAPPRDDGRIEQLEERVRVLEQIVTDSGYELRRQFRDLERDD